MFFLSYLSVLLFWGIQSGVKSLVSLSFALCFWQDLYLKKLAPIILGHLRQQFLISRSLNHVLLIQWKWFVLFCFFFIETFFCYCDSKFTEKIEVDSFLALWEKGGESSSKQGCWLLLNNILNRWYITHLLSNSSAWISVALWSLFLLNFLAVNCNFFCSKLYLFLFSSFTS